uniref:Uncharacterized protein n=1 Tax=Branchiostoma floridae TaxID=7739 RepID=C3ZN66_BRAFL|eukprot:XP_002590018.1 hypothetical protein BRAFLDRAFT_81640 [Branchiostoma floridae]
MSVPAPPAKQGSQDLSAGVEACGLAALLPGGAPRPVRRRPRPRGRCSEPSGLRSYSRGACGARCRTEDRQSTAAPAQRPASRRGKGRAPVPFVRCFHRGGLFPVRRKGPRVAGDGCATQGARGLRRGPVAHPTRLETRTKESNVCASHWVLYETQRRNEGEGPSVGPRWDPRRLRGAGAPPADLDRSVGEVALERARWDPRDGELCPSRTKPGETLVEVRSDSDVQIDRQTWV